MISVCVCHISQIRRVIFFKLQQRNRRRTSHSQKSHLIWVQKHSKCFNLVQRRSERHFKRVSWWIVNRFARLWKMRLIFQGHNKSSDSEIVTLVSVTVKRGKSALSESFLLWSTFPCFHFIHHMWKYWINKIHLIKSIDSFFYIVSSIAL